VRRKESLGGEKVVALRFDSSIITRRSGVDLGTSLVAEYFVNINGEFGYTSSRLFRSSVSA
jgi:hypothetical protein